MRPRRRRLRAPGAGIFAGPDNQVNRLAFVAPCGVDVLDCNLGGCPLCIVEEALIPGVVQDQADAQGTVTGSINGVQPGVAPGGTGTPGHTVGRNRSSNVLASRLSRTLVSAQRPTDASGCQCRRGQTWWKSSRTGPRRP